VLKAIKNARSTANKNMAKKWPKLRALNHVLMESENAYAK